MNFVRLSDTLPCKSFHLNGKEVNAIYSVLINTHVEAILHTAHSATHFLTRVRCFRKGSKDYSSVDWGSQVPNASGKPAGSRVYSKRPISGKSKAGAKMVPPNSTTFDCTASTSSTVTIQTPMWGSIWVHAFHDPTNLSIIHRNNVVR